MSFNECRGNLIVEDAAFLSSSPWILPFCISELKGKSLNTLPMAMKVYNRDYLLGGFSMVVSGHYTAVIIWRGYKLFYDGLSSTDDTRLQSLKQEHFKNKVGSYAFYFHYCKN